MRNAAFQKRGASSARRRPHWLLVASAVGLSCTSDSLKSLQHLAAPPPAPEGVAEVLPGVRRPGEGAAPITAMTRPGISGLEMRDREVSAFFTSGGLRVALPGKPVGPGGTGRQGGWALGWSVEGAAPVEPRPEAPLGTKVHRLVGDRKEWQTGLEAFGRVAYDGVLPGVDLHLEAVEHGVKYLASLAAGVPAASVRFRYDGATDVRVLGGDLGLEIATGEGVLTESGLKVFQTTEQGDRPLVSRYRVARAPGVQAWWVSIEVDGADPALPITIDPTLNWSSFLGGAGADFAQGIALDAAGDAYVVGVTQSPDFPTTVGAYRGVSQQSGNDAFVTKLKGDGTAIVWSTLLGGKGHDYGYAIAVGTFGVYVAGTTESTDFPMVSPVDSTFAGTTEVFVARLKLDGSGLDWSTYLGGTAADSVTYNGLAVDSSGSAYVTGTASTGFPLGPTPYDGTFAGTSEAFVTKLNLAGTLGYSTFLGGSGADVGNAIRVDAASQAYVTGTTDSSDFPTVTPFRTAPATPGDSFVVKLNAIGSAPVFSSYLGALTSIDNAYALALDTATPPNLYIAGETQSTDWPVPQNVAPSGTNAFVVKVLGAGTGVGWTRYVGGGGSDLGFVLAADAANLYLGGLTLSTDFPVTNAFDTELGGIMDGFALKLSQTGTTVSWATYVGGTLPSSFAIFEGVYGIAVDSGGKVFLSGQTPSTDFPVGGVLDLAFGGNRDGFVLRLNGGALPVAIDWGTFLGGGGTDGDMARAVAVDAAGAVYVTGSTSSAIFPTTAGVLDTSYNGLVASPTTDAFVAKFNADKSLAWSTYLGGLNADVGWAIAVDGTGAVYVGGSTSSSDFPASNAYASLLDGFVTKISSDGSTITWSKFFGGTGNDSILGLGLDATLNVFVTGYTSSDNFPLALAFDSLREGEEAVAAKLDPAGTLVWSSFLGGVGNDRGMALAVDGAQNVWVTGYTQSNNFPSANGFDTALGGTQDAFVTKINGAAPPGVPTVAWSSYLGGATGTEQGNAVALDGSGNAVVVGWTQSTDFPQGANPGYRTTLWGTQDSFVAKVAAGGGAQAVQWTTYLGAFEASNVDWANGVALDSLGNVVVVGSTSGTSFPITGTTAFDTTLGGNQEGYVARLADNGFAVLSATYLGGGSNEDVAAVALDSSNRAYVVGQTFSTDFPVVAGSYDLNIAGTNDAFVSRLDFPVGAASRLLFTARPATLGVYVAGTDLPVTKVLVADAEGNAITSWAGNISLGLWSSPQNFFDQGTTLVNPQPSGTATFSGLRINKAGAGYRLRADSPGLTPASFFWFSITAASASQFAFVPTTQTVQANACSAVTNVQVQDAFGNNTTVASAVTIALSGGGTSTMTFYSDSNCSTGLPSNRVVVAAGQQTAPFYFKDTKAGSPTLVGSVVAGQALTPPGPPAQTITPAAATNFVFGTSGQPAKAGACSGQVALTMRDAFGNSNAPVGSNTAITLTRGGAGTAMTFYSDSNCSIGLPSNQVTVSAGSSSAVFYFKDTVVGFPTISAASTPLLTPPGPQTETITPGDAASFYLVGIYTRKAGVCSPAVSVRTRDTYSNLNAPVTGDTTVTLTAAGAGTQMTFYSDAACGTPLAANSVVVPSGAYSASFFFKDTVPGSPTISSAVTSGPNLTPPGPLTEFIIPGDATKFVFSTTPQTVKALTCSGAVTINTHDTYDNANGPVAVSTTFTASASGTSTMTFYVDGACGTQLTAGNQFTLAPGVSTGTFYFRDTTVGTPTVSLTSSPLLTAPLGQPETITPGWATKLVFETTSQSVTAGECSNAVTLATRDGNDNVNAPVQSNTTVTLTPGGAGTAMTFYSDPGCSVVLASSQMTLAAGSSSASFYFRDTVAGSRTIAVTSSASLTLPAPQPETITAGPASKLHFASLPLSAKVGSCSGRVDLVTRDDNGNSASVSGNTTVTLSASGTGTVMTFYQDATCQTALSGGNQLSITTGQSTASFYFEDSVVGTPTISASVTGGPALSPASQGETITAQDAASFVFDTLPQDVQAGACSSAVTLVTRDAVGNPLAGVTADTTFTVTPSGTTTIGLFSNSACTTPLSGNSVVMTTGQTTASFYFKDSKVGSPSLAVAVTLGPPLTAPPAQTENIVVGAATKFVFSSSAFTVPVATCAGPVGFEVRDVGDNPGAPVAGDTTVSLTAGGAGTAMTFYSDTTCQTPLPGGNQLVITAGQSTGSFYFMETKAGSPTIIPAVTAGPNLTAPAAQPQAITVGPANRLVFGSGSQIVGAGSCSALVQLVVTDTYLNPNAPVAGQTVISVTPGPSMSLFSDSSCLVPLASNQVTIALGQSTASFFFKATAVGSESIGVSVSSGPSLAAPVPQPETIVVGTASAIAFSTSSQTVPAGVCSGIVTLVTKDASGNLNAPVATNTTLAVTAPPAAGMTFYSNSNCSSALSGGGNLVVLAAQSSASFYFKATTAGLQAISVSAISGMALVAPTPQEETITPGAASQLVFAAEPQSTAADQPLSVQVSVADAFANPVPSYSTSISLALGAGSPQSQFSLGSGATEVVPQGGVASFTGLRLTTVGSGYTLVATSGALAKTSTSFAIAAGPMAALAFLAPPQSAAAGATLPPIKVSVMDGFGNLVATAVPVTLAVLSGTQSVFSSGGGQVAAVAGVATFAGVKLNAAGTYVLRASVAGVAVDSAPFVISAGAPQGLVFAMQPAGATAGSIMAEVTVRLVDAVGNVVASNREVALAIFSGPQPGFTGGTTTVQALAGTASFGDLSLGTAGEYVLVASMDAFTAKSDPFTIVAGDLVSLAFGQQPRSGTAGQTLEPVVVVAYDAFANPILGAANPVVLTIKSGPSASFSAGATSAELLAGLATFADLQVDAAGEYVLTAALGSVSVDSDPFVVAAASVGGGEDEGTAVKAQKGGCCSAATSGDSAWALLLALALVPALGRRRVGRRRIPARA